MATTLRQWFEKRGLDIDKCIVQADYTDNPQAGWPQIHFCTAYLNYEGVVPSSANKSDNVNRDDESPGDIHYRKGYQQGYSDGRTDGVEVAIERLSKRSK